MKAVLTAVVLIYSFACLASELMRMPHKRAPLKGKIKTIRYYSLRMLSDQLSAIRRKNYTVDSFNSAGLKVLSYYMADGILSDEDVYKYQYDAQAKVTRECVLYNNLSRCTTYAYDTSGKLIEEVTNFPWGEVRTIKYIYTNGRLAAKDENSKEIITFAYNDKGQVVKETVQRADGSNSVTKYTYDDDGNIRSEAYVYDSSSRKTVYTYDEHNNEILAEESFNNGPVLRRFRSEYLYDKQGNWIRCIEEEADINPGYWVKEISIREIEYY